MPNIGSSQLRELSIGKRGRTEGLKGSRGAQIQVEARGRCFSLFERYSEQEQRWKEDLCGDNQQKYGGSN